MWKFSGQSVGPLLTYCQIQDKEKQGAQVLPGMRTRFGSQEAQVSTRAKSGTAAKPETSLGSKQSLELLLRVTQRPGTPG